MNTRQVAGLNVPLDCAGASVQHFCRLFQGHQRRNRNTLEAQLLLNGVESFEEWLQLGFVRRSHANRIDKPNGTSSPLHADSSAATFRHADSLWITVVVPEPAVESLA